MNNWCCQLTIAALESFLERMPNFPFLALAFDEAGALPSCFTVSASDDNRFSFSKRKKKIVKSHFTFVSLKICCHNIVKVKKDRKCLHTIHDKTASVVLLRVY